MKIRTALTSSPALFALALLTSAVAVPAAAQDVPAIDDLSTPPLPSFDIPQPQRFELDNGMVVMLVEDHELPLVEGIALIRTGARYEPADKLGLAGLTGDVLRSGGAGERTGDALDEFLEGTAASIEASIAGDMGRVRMSSLADDFPEVLAAFADVLRRPRFEAEKLDLAKNDANAAISRQNDNPQGILFREASQIVYGEDSPYARSETYETIAGITRDDLVAWHEQYFHPERVILGFVGDFDTEEALAEIRSAFGDWSRGDGPAPPAIPVEAEFDPGVYYIEKNDLTQSNIAMGHLGVRKDHPDFYPIEVMNNVLSGSFASRLFNNVRTSKGLAYAVTGAVNSNYDSPSLFFMFMTTKTETTGAGIEALLEEARNMTAQPPTDEEVERAKTAIENSYVFNFDSPGKILNQQLQYEYFGYPLDRTERYLEAIGKVTTEQVRQAAAKHIRPDELAILVVGPSEGRDKPLETYGPVTPVDITIPEPAADKAEVTAEGSEQAAALLDRALAAMGGATAVDGADTMRVSGTLAQVTPGGEFEIPFQASFDFPDRLRQALTLPMGEMALVVDGDRGFAVTPQGINDMSGAQLAQMKETFSREVLLLLKARGEEGFSAVALDPGEQDGQAVERVQLEVHDLVTVLHIHPEDGRIIGMSYRGSGPSGAPGQVVKVFEDFRESGDLVLPWKEINRFEGEIAATVQLESFEVGVEFDEGTFERPSEGE
ncbi:MAG: pitrilysin family protein [Acidobacteriota bacterium]